MAKSVILLCVAVCVLMPGCASWQACRFGVTGQLAIPEGERRLEKHRLVAEIESALQPLGFSSAHVMPKVSPELIVFSLGDGFSIAKDRIDVGLEPDSMSIFVRDYKDVEESAKTAKVIEVIEKRVGDSFHANITFTRVTRCII
jgi:hypothetical protein